MSFLLSVFRWLISSMDCKGSMLLHLYSLFSFDIFLRWFHLPSALLSRTISFSMFFSCYLYLLLLLVLFFFLLLLPYTFHLSCSWCTSPSLFSPFATSHCISFTYTPLTHTHYTDLTVDWYVETLLLLHVHWSHILSSTLLQVTVPSLPAFPLWLCLQL